MAAERSEVPIAEQAHGSGSVWSLLYDGNGRLIRVDVSPMPVPVVESPPEGWWIAQPPPAQPCCHVSGSAPAAGGLPWEHHDHSTGPAPNAGPA